MTRAHHVRHSKSFWDKHVKHWQNSGLSQSEYCRRNNIKEKAFGYHKVTRCGADYPPSKSKKSLELVALPFNLSHDLPAQSLACCNIASGISISLGSRATINIDRSFDKECLSKILHIVSEL